MPKKACCCAVPKTTCPWCDYGWGGDQYNGEQAGPATYSGLTGTITTEIPSIGHPWMGTFDSGLCGYDEYRTTPKSPLPSAKWGDSTVYGDISPAWFNGIDMNQSLDSATSETNAYFKFVFYLKIEKRNNDGSYSTVINIDWEGYGKNLRPHPDACKSYLLTNQTFREDICNEFSPAGENLECSVDFAKMPRGPWPYRLVNKNLDYLDLDCANESGPQLSQNCTCGRGMTDFCKKCTTCCSESNNGTSNGDNCFYLSDKGTPYGWEDCPKSCSEFSNYNSTTDNLHFFSWLSPFSRYTTPEWDVKDIQTNNTRKLSIHSLVPNKSNIDYCNPVGTIGLGFGEWCFGMDLEAPSEISTLESAGFNWSDGREKKGLWINKTPTNALRVLFTLDHSDIEPGKVFRVFRDWDVENGAQSPLLWDNNEEGLFRVTFKQKVTELAFSSLGCDCPEGNCDTSPLCNNDYYPGCHDYRVGGLQSKPCWSCKVSFTERGPQFIKLYADSENTGILQSETGNCKTKFGTKMCADNGLILFAAPDGGQGNKLAPASYPSFGSDVYDIPYLDAIGDHPYGIGTGKGSDIYRYRSAYVAVHSVVENFCSSWRDCNNMPPFIYGSKSCTITNLQGTFPVQMDAWSTCGGQPGCITQYNLAYEYAPINLDPWPSTFPVNKCTQFSCGCPQFSDCNTSNLKFKYKTDDGGPDIGVYHAEPFEEPPNEPICGCPNTLFCHENEECINNLLKPDHWGGYIRSNCNNVPEGCYGHGEMGLFCDADYKKIGIDCNYIVFNAGAGSVVYGGVGPVQCAQQCFGNSCYKLDNQGNPTNTCLFCEADGSVNAGYCENTSIDWRKLLCYRKKSQPESQLSTIIPPNLMSNFELYCDRSASCEENPLFPDAPANTSCNGCGGPGRFQGSCDCYFMTSRQTINGNCNPDGGDNVPLGYYACQDPAQDDDQTWTVYTEPWNNTSIQETWMKAYPTKYKSQSINGNRVPNYIKINALGPYTE